MTMDIESLTTRLEQANAACERILASATDALEGLEGTAYSAVEDLKTDGAISAEVQRLSTSQRGFLQGYQSLNSTVSDASSGPRRPPPMCKLTRLTQRRLQTIDPDNESLTGRPIVTEPSSMLQGERDADARMPAIRSRHRLDRSGLRANETTDVTVEAQLGNLDLGGTGTGATRSASDAGCPSRNESLPSDLSNTSTVQDEMTRQRALVRFGAQLTSIMKLDEDTRPPATMLGQMVTFALRDMERDVAIPPPPVDRDVDPLETLRIANDKTQSDLKTVGDLMAKLYMLRGCKEALEGLPEASASPYSSAY